jgi:hypothetical protein
VALSEAKTPGHDLGTGVLLAAAVRFAIAAFVYWQFYRPSRYLSSGGKLPASPWCLLSA